MSKSNNAVSHFTLKSFLIFCLLFLSLPLLSFAATLSVSPGTGVYVTGNTFTARVVVNTQGKSINATEGVLKYNPQELSVVSINRTGSIFNLWVTEPTFSNSAGTINFSGGVPSGYTGSAGTIFNVTFRAATAGAARVTFSEGSVLANDGMGTNVLSGMSGGNFTIQVPPATTPTPEVVEYVAPANTPALPIINSSSHSVDKWSNNKTAVLSWSLPVGITAVRTALDKNPNTIPTKVYDNPIREITLNNLEEGVSYFHLQFRNNEGWGRVAHFKLMVDTEKPTLFEISSPEDADFASPIQTLILKAEDETSGVYRYKIRINADEPFEFVDEEEVGEVVLPTLVPGYHTIIIEAFDRAGNSLVSSHSFTIEAFSKPIFTEYPNEINEEVIPVIKGKTRPNSQVEVYLRKVGQEPNVYTVVSDSEGTFIFIPEGTFTNGVYEISARATDEFGAKSDLSDVIRIAVQQPGYVQVGTFIINVLSVMVPLIATLLLLILLLWYSLVYLRKFKRRVSVESGEAVDILDYEFKNLKNNLDSYEKKLQANRKTKKLTIVESEMMEGMKKNIDSAYGKIRKEIVDVEKVVQKKK